MVELYTFSGWGGTNETFTLFYSLRARGICILFFVTHNYSISTIIII